MSERDKDIAMQAAIREERDRLWRERVRRVRQDNPDMTLDALAVRFSATPSRIARALK